MILRVPEVCRLLTCSRTTLWRMVKSGDFPEPLRIGKRGIAWQRKAVEQWMDSAAKP